MKTVANAPELPTAKARYVEQVGDLTLDRKIKLLRNAGYDDATIQRLIYGPLTRAERIEASKQLNGDPIARLEERYGPMVFTMKRGN